MPTATQETTEPSGENFKDEPGADVPDLQLHLVLVDDSISEHAGSLVVSSVECVSSQVEKPSETHATTATVKSTKAFAPLTVHTGRQCGLRPLLSSPPRQSTEEKAAPSGLFLCVGWALGCFAKREAHGADIRLRNQCGCCRRVYETTSK